ncbi:hypothetical protein FGRMN_4447 [Fusarium graminum]|nr:hypothetical protein FGRMN_4447 [Fusarium graminum]
MRSTEVVMAALGWASVAMADAKYSFSCGCDGQSDALADACQDAINQIDLNMNDLDPMKAIDTKKVGVWTNVHVFYRVGNCEIGTASQTTPPASGGDGGAIAGTRVNGQDFKDQLQAMLDECRAPNGYVNSCSSVGAGNIVLFGTGETVITVPQPGVFGTPPDAGN